VRRAPLLLGLWVGLAGATPIPLTPPPPDITSLVPFVAAPLDKPPVLADAPVPSPPVDLPALPLAPIVLPAADKPMAFVQPPRALPCIGAWTGVASESLECGRARIQRGEWEDAARALENATRPGTDPDVLRDARYWLGEVYYRLGRIEQADFAFRQVAQERPRQEVSVWALHSSGWTALRLGDAVRAREAFSAVLGGTMPATVEAWARHGLGLASYALGRHADAVQAWSQLLQRGAPMPLARDGLFWHGEALGRVNEPGRAEADLRRFLDGGPHHLAATARLRLGWWALAAGHVPEALAAFRAYAPPANSPERDWGEAGLALTLLGSGDWKAARDAAGALNARRSPLALPLLFRLLRAAVDAPATAEVDAVTQDALAANLTPAARGWVLIAKGEVDRAQNKRDEARTQFDLARTVAAGTPLAAQATFRLARVNFELREFGQALSDVSPLAQAALPADLRAAVLTLQGEAAYQAGDYPAAAAAFRRLLVEFPDSRELPMIRQAVAWTSLRQGRPDAARREFLEFAAAHRDHASAVDATVLAAELALTAGDYETARQLLDRVIQAHPTHPRTDFARINRAIMLVRTGDFIGGRAAVTDWLRRAPFPALFGRAHAALAAALIASGDGAGAQRELALARKEGLAAFASVGEGVIALQQRRWDDALSRFQEARDAGTPDIVAAAEYGAAAAALAKGAVTDFKKPAAAALAAIPADPRHASRTAALLYVLTGIAVEEKDWAGALAHARRLVNEHGTHEAADDGLERVAAGATRARQWTTAIEADTLLRHHYPRSPFTATARMRLAEALVETGRLADARSEVEALASEMPNDARVALMQARVREAGGDRSGALEAYARAARNSRGAELTAPALMGHARLLLQERRWDQARAVLERLLRHQDTALAAEAAQGIGDSYAGEGDALAAAEYYLTAAYMAPSTPSGRRGLLGAARAFVALNQPEAAAGACRKLLGQSDVPAELAATARQTACSKVR
jgi:tetratricopeptide (TPR) repeat protein